MTKRVLVTGAGGFLGAHCASRLAESGWDVVGVSRGQKPDALPAVRWEQTDLLDAAATTRLMAAVRPTHLLHLAWLPVRGDVMRSPENIDWIRASLFLAQAFQEAGGERLASAGSCAEYTWDSGICINGKTPLAPTTLYGAAKLSLLIALEAYSRTVGISFVWPRVFFVYGPGEHPTRLTASVISALLHDQPVACTAGTQRRDYLHVTDVAAGIVAALESTHEGPIDIASGAAIEVRELAIRAARELGKPELLKLGEKPSPPDLAPLVQGEAGEAARVLRWRPRIELAQGIAETVAWGKSAFARAGANRNSHA